MKEEITLAIPYEYHYRPYQLQFWEAMRKKKRAVLVWHRRAGKEKTCWNYLIAQAVQRVGIYYYIFPDSKMARRILWDGIDKQGFKLLKHIPDCLIAGVNNTEMKVNLKNGSVILVLGSRDEDTLRGPNPVGCVFSEYAEQSPMAWQIVSPILLENGGWAIFNFTPKGQNHAKDLYEMAKYNPNWHAELLTIQDTGVISSDEIEEIRKEGIMSEDMIQQEFFCSFTLGIEGSYYAKYIQDAKDEGRIGNVPWDKAKRVYTAWDIGYGDSTAIIWYQIVGQEVHLIDYYENHGEGFAHYADVISKKPYIYADHFGPHDIEAHDFSSGLSPKELGRDMGIRFTTLPTLKVGLENGIEALRSIFPRLWIDAVKCKQLLKCLENYRKEFDVHHNVYKIKPLHDWSSHGADSARYMAIAVKRYVDAPKDGIDDDKANGWYNQFNPRFD
jgi:phage terminase large subunit